MLIVFECWGHIRKLIMRLGGIRGLRNVDVCFTKAEI